MRSKALLIIIGFLAFNIQIYAQIVDPKEFEPIEKFAGGCPEGPPCSKTRGLIKPRPETNSTTDSPVENENQTNIENKADGSTEPMDEKSGTNKVAKKVVGKKKHHIKK